MKFSIVIPFYNDAKSLNRLFITLDDYLNDPDVEIIFIDDASEPDQIEALKIMLNDTANNIKLLTNNENKGASFSRQQGIENSTADFIAFLDSDDGWSKNKAYLQYDFMVKTEAVISGGPATQIAEVDFDVLRKKPVNFNNYQKATFLTSLFKNPFSTPSIMVKRSEILKCPFNITMRYSEDVDCWRRILTTNEGYKLISSGTYMFKHAYLSSSNSLSSNTKQMTIGEIKSLFRLFKHSNIGIATRSYLLSAILFAAAKGILREIRKLFHIMQARPL